MHPRINVHDSLTKARSVAGMSRPCIVLTRRSLSPRRRSAAVFSPTLPTLTPASLAWHRGKPSPLIRSSDCYWRPRGNWPNEEALPRCRSRVPKPVASLACCTMIMKGTGLEMPVTYPRFYISPYGHRSRMYTDGCWRRLAELEAHLGLGSSGSVISGRISYCFVSAALQLSHYRGDYP